MGARVYIPTLGRFLSVDPIEGGTPNNYVYPPDTVNENDISGMCPWCVLALPFVLKALTVAVESYGGHGEVPKPIAKTVKQSAVQLSKAVGKNSVSIKTSKGIVYYDLQGASHYNKQLGNRVPTPHVQVRAINNGYYGNKGNARPMNYGDLRNVRGYLKSQNRRR